MALSNDALRTAREGLYAAVLSDVLDSLALHDQAMAPGIRPLDDTVTLFGRARTGLYMEVFDVAPGENPYEVEIALIDDLKPGEVAVFGCGGSPRIAPWGELLTTAAMARGATGCVTDGLVRDTRMIRGLGFPVFHGGIGPLDSRGRGKMMWMDRRVACGGVAIEPGDLVFGDADGVVVVPQRVEEQAIELALEKVAGEDRTREELRDGAKLADVFEKYGIL